MRAATAEKDHFVFTITVLALLVLASLTGAIYVTTPSRPQIAACELLQTASDEADLAPAWYLRAGEVLEACGQDRAKADAAARACFAEARNGYRDSKECEAMP